jgi:hypothetical protein
MDSFKEALEAAGGDPAPDRWPPLTDRLREAVHRVRNLRKELADALPRARWPTQLRACWPCNGEGATYELADEDVNPWFTTHPCRPCLSTGLTLRPPGQD